jgi:hypothetical protein
VAYLNVRFSGLAKESVSALHYTFITDREESIRKLQSQWEETTKGAIAKEIFLSVGRRLAVNLHLNRNVTTILSGDGNI